MTTDEGVMVTLDVERNGRRSHEYALRNVRPRTDMQNPQSPLARFKDRHKGATFAILCNGPSLTDYDLKRIRPDVVTMGINRSFEVHESTYLVCVDGVWFTRNREALEPYAAREALFSSGSKPYGIMITSMNRITPEAPFWSWDLTVGSFTRGTPYVALQLAVWMGAARVYFLGLDLKPRDVEGEERGHFYAGHPMSGTMPGTQNVAFSHAALLLRGKVECFNCYEDSACEAFIYRPFSDLT